MNRTTRTSDTSICNTFPQSTALVLKEKLAREY